MHGCMHVHPAQTCSCGILILLTNPESIDHEKINNKGNVNVHRQDVVVPDCVHPNAPRSTVFFSFQGKSDKSQEKNNNQILMPSLCIPINNHASGQLSQITNEEGLVKKLRLCFTLTKNRRRVPHFFCSSNLLNRIK